MNFRLSANMSGFCSDSHILHVWSCLSSQKIHKHLGVIWCVHVLLEHTYRHVAVASGTKEMIGKSHIAKN